MVYTACIKYRLLLLYRAKCDANWYHMDGPLYLSVIYFSLLRTELLDYFDNYNILCDAILRLIYNYHASHGYLIKIYESIISPASHYMLHAHQKAYYIFDSLHAMLDRQLIISEITMAFSFIYMPDCAAAEHLKIRRAIEWRSGYYIYAAPQFPFCQLMPADTLMTLLASSDISDAMHAIWSSALPYASRRPMPPLPLLWSHKNIFDSDFNYLIWRCFWRAFDGAFHYNILAEAHYGFSPCTTTTLRYYWASCINAAGTVSKCLNFIYRISAIWINKDYYGVDGPLFALLFHFTILGDKEWKATSSKMAMPRWFLPGTFTRFLYQSNTSSKSLFSRLIMIILLMIIWI